jgi:hypothetical protein
MFFVELKPAPNNKGIFNVEYIQQCKIKFKPPKHKRDIAQCANCQKCGHTEKKDLTMSDVGLRRTSSCELQGRYSLERPTKENTPTSQPGSSPTNPTLFTQPAVTQITKQNSYAPTNIEKEPHMSLLN